MPKSQVEIENIEIEILLDGIKKRYGYDFTHYSQASLRRRLEHVRGLTKVDDYVSLLSRLFHDPVFFDEFLRQMSITVTEMFRDPDFYKSVRDKVVPILKTFPYVKIWHAGCATGEEVYSMAILLHEENFLSRAQIYATDFNKHSLDIAQNGIYPAKNMELYESNYKRAGFSGNFSDYYSDKYDLVKFKDFLKQKITFSYHNLVTDSVFGEMNMICCRNVLIYFDRELQNRVLTTMTKSLRHGGFLCLGTKETINFTEVKPIFDEVEKKNRIFKKIGAESAAA